MLRFLARNDCPLRGHSDWGAFKAETPQTRDGCFRDLVRFAVNCGDPRGASLLNGKLAENAKYLSPDIQNEILDVMASLVLKDVVAEINGSDCFSIMADETSSHRREILTIGVRYVTVRNKPTEVFLGLRQITSATGQALADEILNWLGDLGEHFFTEYSQVG